MLPVDCRDDDVLDAGEVGGDVLGVVSFVDEVELARDHPAHLFGDEAEVERLVEAVEDGDEERDVLQVVLDQALDAGVLHLDGDNAPVVQDGAVYLRQRCRGDRRGFELSEHRLERLTQLALDDLPDHLEGLRRHLVLQVREHVDVLVRHDVRPAAEELQRLDQQTLLAHSDRVEALGAAPMVALTGPFRPGVAPHLLQQADPLVAGE